MLSKQSQYILKALSYIVKNRGLVDIKTIADRENIPLHFLASLMQELARKKVISSKKGKNGGFFLTDKQKEISIFEVISHFEDMDKFSSCGMGFRYCSEEKPCPLHSYYKKYREGFKQTLVKQKIKNLADSKRK